VSFPALAASTLTGLFRVYGNLSGVVHRHSYCPSGSPLQLGERLHDKRKEHLLWRQVGQQCLYVILFENVLVCTNTSAFFCSSRLIYPRVKKMISSSYCTFSRVGWRFLFCLMSSSSSSSCPFPFEGNMALSHVRHHKM